MFKLSIIAASHRPHIFAVVLIVAGHEANAHAHVPCVVGVFGVVGIGSTRPVITGLHIDKRVVGRQRRAVIIMISQAI